MRLLATAALVLSLAAPLPAAAEFFARNSLRVFPTSDPRVMEVVPFGAAGGSEFFCAAGEYARGPLGARSTDSLVLVRGARPSPRFQGRRTVLIALVPRGTPLPRGGLILSQRSVGENLTVGHSRLLCNVTPNRR